MARIRTDGLPTFVAATRDYEAWVAGQTAVVRADLAYKHEQMTTATFPFLRATFYRWIQLWPGVCPELAKAPVVLAVGDLHTQNFGTWRDREGRLIWGVNDFDEAYPLAYTNDLVRLATSARLSIAAGVLALTPRRASAAILDGYSTAVAGAGRPFVLAEQYPVLLAEAQSELRNPVAYWRRMDALPAARRPPQRAAALIRAALPKGTAPRLATRRTGLGSLGHPRIVGLAQWDGGRIAREAKALVASGAVWAEGGTPSRPHDYAAIVRRAVRCPDPFLEVCGEWVVRRLAPDCSRIDFTAARTAIQQIGLLTAMGAETANIHLGSGERRTRAVRTDLAARRADWLHLAAKAMERATLSDYAAWCRQQR